MKNMLETIVDIILDACDELSEEDITPEARFIEDLNVSSLESMEILSDIEEEFDIRISSTESRRLLTVADLLHQVEEKA